MMNLTLTNLVYLWVILLGLLLIVPLLASALISALTSHTNMLLIARFGENAPMFFGWLGVIVHELSHAGMALLFFHKIDRIQLLQHPFKKDHAGRLGYVSHAWSPHNWYQQAGNFFIGIAPLFGIGLMGFAITKFLWPEILQLNMLGLTIFNGQEWWKLLIWFYVMVNLVLGLNLSDADWQNTRSGILIYALLLTILSSLLWLLNLDHFAVWGWLGQPIFWFYVVVFGVAFILYVIVSVLVRLL